MSFYRRCQAYGRRRSYPVALTAEFPAWALLHWTPQRSRVDLLFIDFIRSELGASGSERQRCLREGGGGELAEASCQPSQEAEVLVGECLDAVTGRDRTILTLHVLGELSLAEVGEALDLSKTRVNQCKRDITAKLRQVMGA